MIRHRLSRTSLDREDETIDPAKPLYIALYGERSKKSGYARLALGAKAGTSPANWRRLLWEDEDDPLNLTRARECGAPTALVRGARRRIPRPLPGRPRPRQGPPRDEYQRLPEGLPLGANSELVDFENEHGVKLQGSLLYPANYKAGKEVPDDRLHLREALAGTSTATSRPSARSTPTIPTVYSAQGYFVFQPDIVYRPQEPGISALECVVPAVEESACKSGMVDREARRPGRPFLGRLPDRLHRDPQRPLRGRAWPGAPLTNMMSMSVSVYWNSGQTNAAIFTQSQGRMDKPFWRDVENYVRKLSHPRASTP